MNLSPILEVSLLPLFYFAQKTPPFPQGFYRWLSLAVEGEELGDEIFLEELGEGHKLAGALEEIMKKRFPNGMGWKRGEDKSSADGLHNLSLALGVLRDELGVDAKSAEG